MIERWSHASEIGARPRELPRYHHRGHRADRKEGARASERRAAGADLCRRVGGCLSALCEAFHKADKLFSKLDTSGQGYIEKSDLETAFASISGGSTDVDSLFTQLDADSDGKVTKEEFSDKLQQLAQQLDDQFQSSRMQAGGMPPPPPPADDQGFTKDELTSQLEEVGETDSTRSSLLSGIIENFEAADTDGDGKVSFREAMAYQQSSSGGNASSTATTSTGSGAAASNEDIDARLMLQIMRLMQAYGAGNEDGATSSLRSIAA